LDSRMAQTDQLVEIKKGCLNEDSTGIMSSFLWFDKEDLYGKILVNNKDAEIKINCEIVDIPSIYHYKHKNFPDLFNQLADTDDYNLFQSRPIQNMIDFNYPLVQKFTIKKLLMPFIAYLVLFVTYTNLIFDFYFNA
jgi:hypothetical protein